MGCSVHLQSPTTNYYFYNTSIEFNVCSFIIFEYVFISSEKNIQNIAIRKDELKSKKEEIHFKTTFPS